MLVCVDCGALFNDPAVYCDTHGLDAPPFEVKSGCPVCGGMYTEAPQCFVCGEPITGKYIKLDNGDCVCCNCYTEKTTDNAE